MNINNIYCDDCAILLNQSNPSIVDLTITSPPYDNLRDYNGYSFDIDKVVSGLYNITKDGGVVVWVVGDATINGSETGTSFKQALKFMSAGFRLHDTMIYEKNSASFPASKHRSNRYTQIFEYMFIFSKGKPKTVNLICDKPNIWAGSTSYGLARERTRAGNIITRNHKIYVADYGVRNNIWKYNVGAGFSSKDKMAFKHPAIFPEQLVQDHIISWSNEGDIVLDPFCGSGTTLKIAKLLNRYYIGIDISEEYCSLSEKRLQLL